MNEQPITKLVEFLKSEYGDTFHAYYDGDPDEIPKSNLPCVICVKNSDRMENGPTGMQRVTEELVVKVVLNKEDDWQSDVDPTKLTEKRIRDIVEARAPAGGYDPSTVKYALMNRFRMSGVALDQSMTFELGALPRTEDLITEEGHLTISVTYLMPNVPVT